MPNIQSVDISSRYKNIINQMQDVFENKNHDYGNSFLGFRDTTFVDIMRAKLDRVNHLLKMEDKGELPKVAEGVESELRDIANYCVLMIITRENVQME